VRGKGKEGGKKIFRSPAGGGKLMDEERDNATPWEREKHYELHS